MQECSTHGPYAGQQCPVCEPQQVVNLPGETVADKGIVVIRASHYQETEDRLTKDPLVLEMAQDMMNAGDDKILDEYAHPSGTPHSWFMNACNNRYRELGGTDGGHLGAIATAVLRVVRERSGSNA